MRVRSSTPPASRPPVRAVRVDPGPSRLAQQAGITERGRSLKAVGGDTEEDTGVRTSADEPVDEPDTQTLLPDVSDDAKESSCGVSWQVLVAMVTASVVICYADRSNISTAILPMSEQYGWDKGQEGTILSAFFGGYLATQLLGGQLADKYGGRMVLTFGVSAWSLFTFLTPMAADAGISLLLLSRVAMGLGEGVAFPAIHSLIARAVPVERQSTAVGIVTAASYMGTALAFGVSPVIIDQLGWPWAFYIFGALACLWLPFWVPMRPPLDVRTKLAPSRSDPNMRESPSASLDSAESGVLQQLPQQAKHRQLARAAVDNELRRAESQNGNDSDTTAMLSSLETDTPTAAGRQNGAEVGLKALLKTKEVWAICIAQYTGSWGLYGLLNWLPTFFKEQYHIEIADLGSYTLLPYVVQGGVGAAAGVIADKLLERGWHVRSVRRTLQLIGMLGPAACLLISVSPITDNSASLASAWITIGLGLSAFTLGAVSVSHLDIAPKHAGAVFGAGNTAATTAGLLAVPVTGFILDQTGSWPLVFTVTAAHYVVGAAMYTLWVGSEPLPQDG
ncbi:hypothetical protein WJX72_002260 [[Myrmecia] bisecta]|uniref:Major facilitator superfamily (MFS) profile domain-containing protein n=1 Tax=[Myrmecia] bisecta TaxID=41462 RepID=A0AAW1R4X6_9CHLO